MSGRRPAVRDPYGLLPKGSAMGPLLALVGLAVVAILTLDLLGGRIPLTSSSGGGGGGGGAVGDLTPAPSNVIIVPKNPRAEVPGSIVYAKQGSIWVQTGTTVLQLTAGHQDSMPSWSPDGQWIYFIRIEEGRGLWPVAGKSVRYDLTYPVLMRVPPKGGDPEAIVSGLFKKGQYTWFSWIRQPAVDPTDPNRVAVVSDQPDPTKSDVVLQFYDLATKKFSLAKGTQLTPPLGQQDPTWRPDGALLLYVKNDRKGEQGIPSIWKYNPDTARSAVLTGPGYLAPSWSPDGKYVAATKTSPYGTDVVILDASNGAEILRVTSNGASWSPAWSPRGDAIVYLHMQAGITDLRMATLSGTAPALTVKDTIDLTEVSGLDPSSRPSWYIPPDQLPTPSPSPSPAASASTSPAP